MSLNAVDLNRSWSVRRKGQGRIGGGIPPFAFEQRVIIPISEGFGHGPAGVVLARMFHTDFLRMGGTGYQPVLVGNLPTRLGRAPCRDEEMRREKFDVSLPTGW